MKRVVAIVLAASFCSVIAAPETLAIAQESGSATAAEGRAGAAKATQGEETEAPKLTFAEALSGGKAAVSLRYRFEFVDDDNFELNGVASTLRTALSYGTKPFHGLRVYLQAENVTNVGLGDDHNNKGAGDSGNGVTARPVIADPQGTEMLQAFVEYASNGSAVQLGRQVINLDDQRHIGAVGWRQHWQSHDAVRFRNDRLSNFVFNYAFLDRVHRVFRDKVDTSSHLINAQYKFDGVGAITGYGYFLRYDDEAFYGASRDTVGAEFKGSRAVGSATLHYELEYAHQRNAGNNPTHVDASYLHLVGGVGVGGFTLRLDWERIGGSETGGQFQFALGTNHAFNGWVDKFLSTPQYGLMDLMIRLDGSFGQVKWQLRYHDFRADTGGSRYGSELDLQATYSAPWKQTFAAKVGVYSADELSTDTSKIWLWTSYSF